MTFYRRVRNLIEVIEGDIPAILNFLREGEGSGEEGVCLRRMICNVFGCGSLIQKHSF